MEKDKDLQDKSPLPPSRVPRRKLPEVETGRSPIRIDSTGSVISGRVQRALSRASDAEDEKWRAEFFDQFEILREVLFEANNIAEVLDKLSPMLYEEVISFINLIHIFTFQLLESINIENREVLHDIETKIIFYFTPKIRRFHEEKATLIAADSSPETLNNFLDLYLSKAKTLLGAINNASESERENYDRLNTVFDFLLFIENEARDFDSLNLSNADKGQEVKVSLIKHFIENMQAAEKKIRSTIADEEFFKYRAARHAYDYVRIHLMAERSTFAKHLSTEDLMSLIKHFPELFDENRGKIPLNSQLLGIPQAKLQEARDAIHAKCTPEEIHEHLLAITAIAEEFVEHFEDFSRPLEIYTGRPPVFEEHKPRNLAAIISGTVFAALLATLSGLLISRFADKYQERKMEEPAGSDNSQLPVELAHLLSKLRNLGTAIPASIESLRRELEPLLDYVQAPNEDQVELSDEESFIGAIYKKEFLLGELKYVPQKFYFLIDGVVNELSIHDLAMEDHGDFFTLIFEINDKKYTVELTRDELIRRVSKSVQEGHNSIILPAEVSHAVIPEE